MTFGGWLRLLLFGGPVCFLLDPGFGAFVCVVLAIICAGMYGRETSAQAAMDARDADKKSVEVKE